MGSRLISSIPATVYRIRTDDIKEINEDSYLQILLEPVPMKARSSSQVIAQQNGQSFSEYNLVSNKELYD